MTTALSAATITRLEKIAVDNGFDQERPREGSPYESAQELGLPATDARRIA